MAVLLISSVGEFFYMGGGKKARETAELAVQSKIVGEHCPTKSKVVYKKRDSIIVAVKYWPTGKKKDAYGVAFVYCNRYGGYSSIVTTNGIDYDHISKDTIKELKLRWEIK